MSEEEFQGERLRFLLRRWKGQKVEKGITNSKDTLEE